MNLHTMLEATIFYNDQNEEFQMSSKVTTFAKDKQCWEPDTVEARAGAAEISASRLRP